MYHGGIKRYIKWLKDNQKPYTSISKRDIEAYLQDKYRDSPRETRKGTIKAINFYITECLEQNPVKIKQQMQEKSESSHKDHRAYTIDTVNTIVDSLTEDIDKFAVKLLFEMGGRIQDVALL